MKYSNTVEYNISTKLDSSGLTKLQSQIKQLENSMQQMSNRNIINEEQVKSAKTQLEGLNSALTNSFNSSLGILDLSKFRAELDKSGVSATSLQSAFSMMGAEGQAALNGLTTQIANFNGGIERTSSAVDKIFTTFSNTFRWGMVSSFFSQFMNAIHSSVDYVKELDDSLTQIMLVTDYNRDSMNEFARSANEAAKAVSMTTTGMTNASLIFAQQGYDLGQSQELATLSAKVANASQQDTATTSDQITAYMNAYGLENSISELTQAMDNWALIANISAADVGELAQASQRAASMANTVGVSGEQLAAQIATIESVTREAPEQIGNGLKTLYARFSDISQGGEDENGVSLGDVTKQLNDIGVQVLDQFGNIRDVGDIMEDLMVVWDDLDQTSKIAAAQSLAGKYQVNRFVSLMDNSDMYREYLGATGSAATGTLDQMNEEYAQSIEGRSAKLQASLEGLFSTIFNTDDIYPWMDAAQGAVDLLQQFFDALGGGKTVLLGITSLLTQAFSQNMARSINDMIANRSLGKIREQNINGVNDTLDRVGIDKTRGVGAYISATADQAKLGALNDAQYDAYMNNVQQWTDASTALAKSEEELTNQINTVNMVFGKMGESSDSAILSSKGLDTYGAAESRAALSNQDVAKKLSEIDFSDVAGQAGVIAHQLKTLEEVFKESSDEGQHLDLILDQLAMSLDALADTQGYSTIRAEKMKEGLELLKEKIKEDGEVTETSAKQLHSYTKEMENLKKTAATMTTDQARKVVADAGDSAQKTKSDVDFNKVQVERAEQNALEGQAGIDSQQQIKSILDTMNAVQQLTFAWQAFQGLGSLWANEDLSTGEKVIQTVINLTMAMSQLIPAIDTLKNGGLGQSFQQMNDALSKIQMGEIDFSSDERMVEVNEKLNSLLDKRTIIHKKISEAKKEIYNATKQAAEAENTSAKNAMTGAQLAFKKTLAKKTEKEQNELISILEKEQIANEAAITTAETTRSTIGKIITAELVKQVALQAALTFGIPLLLAGLGAAVGYYQQQREEAEKLKQERLEASNQQTDELKKNAANIQELYNNYKETGEAADGLREALEQQAEALGIVVTAADDYDSLKQKIDEATASQLAYNAALRGEDSSISKTTATDAGLTFEDKEALGIDTTPASYVNTANGQMQYQADGSVSADIAKTVEKSKELIDLEQQSIANRNTELAILDRGNPKEEEKYQLLKQQNIESQNRIDRLTNYVEGNKDYLDNQYAQAENSVLSMALNSDIFKGQENAAGDFEATSYQQALQYVKNITDGLEITEQQQQELAATALEYADNLEGAAQAQLEIAQNQIEQNPYVYSGIRAGESGMNKINELGEKFDLSDQEKAKISDLIDWSDTDELDARVADLAEEIEEGLSQGMSLDDIFSKMKENQEIELTDDEILKQERDDKGYVGEDWERDTEDVKEYADSLQDLAEISDDIADSLKDNRKEALKIADANARLNKGVKSLADSWDDWNKIISDTSKGIEATEDYSDAIHGVEDALTNIFDFDVSTGLADSTQFIKEHMDDIAAAAEGDMDAIERLRVAAAQQILIDADFDWNKINVSQEELFGLISELDNEEIEVGATLDTTTFGEALAIALQAVGATTEEMQKVFDSLGWEPNITYETYKVADNSKQTTDGTIEIVDPKAEGGTRTVKVSDEVVFNGDNTVTIPKINAKGTTYQGSAPKIASPSSRGGGSGGGGGKGKSCFVAGTLVSTSLGFKPIEQIQKGDMVLSYNTLLKRNEYSEVLQTMIHDTIEPIYTLYIKDEQLRVTGIHRFLVTDKITCGVPQWIYAADLKVGQWVFFADGTWHVIHKIETNIEHQIVYNFEVFANHNYYVGRNQILAHNKGGSGKKGGSGGKAKTIEQKDKKDHEKDYYEEVNTQLDKVEKELSRVEKQQDKLVGDKARANQNKQLGLLQKQIELQKEHLRILTEEEKVDVTKHLKEQDKEAEKLVQKYNKLFVIPDPVYDEDGIISNYEQISKAVDDAHNKMIDEYNKAAKTGNEELTKQIQKDIDSLDKYGDAIRKDAQRLDKIVVETEELNNTIQELQDSMQDIRIEAFKNYEEARDGLKDIKESAAELNTIFRDFDPDSFVNSFSIDDTPYDDLIETMNKLDTIYNITKEDAEDFYDKLIKQKEADLAKADELEERMAIQQSIEFFNSRKNNLSADNLNNGYLGVLSQDLATLQEWMDNPTSKDNVFGTDIAALTDTYKETYEALKDGFEEYRKLIQDYRDAALDIYNEAEDAIDRQMDKYDRLVEKVERMSDTYALYYGEDSYAELDKFYAQQGDIMQNQLDQLTTAYEYWNQQYQRALATGDKKLIQEIEDKMNDAEDAMLEKAEELADLWVEKFENVVNANTQSIYDKLFNGNDFNDLTDSWELQKDYMERYKDEVEKSYEIDKLRSKYLDLLNDAQGTSLQTQNKIRQQMQEQLKQLQDQASVSEYDVKLANARLEILQKQIALEDAQRNKNQMQLRRDSQGNYRYTYRANQEDVKAAQDDLLDSEFNAYELTKDETISNNDRALNMVQDFLNKRADIFNKYKDDDEARTKALEQLSADYSKLLGGMEEDFKDTTNGMYDVLTFLVKNGTEDSATSAANMLDNLFEDENKFKEDTEVLWASMTNNITDALGNFEDAVEEANSEMIAQTEDLKEKMAGNKGALTTIGSSADTMTDSLDKAAEATKSLATETQNLYDLFGSDDAKLQDALSSIEKYKQELQDTQDTTSSLAQSLKKANATLDTKTAEAQSYKTALDFATGARQVKEGTKVKLKKGTFVHYDRYGGVQQDAEGNTGWRLPEDMWVKFEAPATERNAKYKYGFYATGDSLTSFGKKQPGDNENGRQNTDQRRHQKWWFNEDELQRNVLAAMDTGGYTGEWEDETPLYKNGKLALLHQKELVLNSSDTENILAAVEIVRTIAAGINNQLTSLSQNTGIRNFNSSLSSIGNEVQQRVEIKAEFPNVQDSYQIEQALLELSDQAYQYAHRNIRG